MGNQIGQRVIAHSFPNATQPGDDYQWPSPPPQPADKRQPETQIPLGPDPLPLTLEPVMFWP